MTSEVRGRTTATSEVRGRIAMHSAQPCPYSDKGKPGSEDLADP